MTPALEELAKTLGTSKTAVEARKKAVEAGNYPDLIEPIGKVAELAQTVEGAHAEAITELMRKARKSFNEGTGRACCKILLQRKDSARDT